jgi:hypothetical protein
MGGVRVGSEKRAVIVRHQKLIGFSRLYRRDSEWFSATAAITAATEPSAFDCVEPSLMESLLPWLPVALQSSPEAVQQGVAVLSARPSEPIGQSVTPSSVDLLSVDVGGVLFAETESEADDQTATSITAPTPKINAMSKQQCVAKIAQWAKRQTRCTTVSALRQVLVDFGLPTSIAGDDLKNAPLVKTLRRVHDAIECVIRKCDVALPHTDTLSDWGNVGY